MLVGEGEFDVHGDGGSFTLFHLFTAHSIVHSLTYLGGKTHPFVWPLRVKTLSTSGLVSMRQKKVNCNT